MYRPVVEYTRNVPNKLTVALISTYPPRECGIATFTRDLNFSLNLESPWIETFVVAITDDGARYPYGTEVRWELYQNDPASYREIAQALNDAGVDVVNIQHEFGIFGGEWGEYVLDLMERVDAPIVTTLHTVLPNPLPITRNIIRNIVRLSDAVVVMLPSAAKILLESYGITSDHKIFVIPHGVPTPSLTPPLEAKRQLGLLGREVITTFGLISSGKGIEDVIEALPQVRAKHPKVLYLILGQTHPNVLRREGEAYRNSLVRRVQDLGLEENVRFDNRYLREEELALYLSATDIYITPYHNPDQVTSGTLSYALGFNRAIIATPYLYARDLLKDGRGILVPFRSPEAIAEAVLYLLDHPDLRAQLQHNASMLAAQMRWPKVARSYLALFTQMSRERVQPEAS
ncbi:MAG: glycosyltransferase family 4 protein [Armatimonadota bacterium]|nr:glycosyltransferase family 4 protein [Armatimonadota bacterium]